MFMYHAWGSHNAWLRQIATRNYLYLHPDTAARFGVADNDWVALSSQHSQIVVPVRLAGNVQPDTVWTWNAIGKRRGAWRLDTNAQESTQGFQIGRASCRERECQYVLISMFAGSLKTKNTQQKNN